MADFDNTAAAPVIVPGQPWADCRLALTDGGTDPLTLKNGDTLDTVLLATGNRVLCTGTRDDAGIYTLGVASSVRATDAGAAMDFRFGRIVHVTAGPDDNVGTWINLTALPVTLGVTELTFSAVKAEPITPAAAAPFDNTAAGTIDL